MEYIILGTVILFLLIMFGIGYNTGLLKILVTLAATVAAIVLSLVLVSPVESFIKKTPVYESVKKQMSGYVSKYIEEGVDASSEELQKDAIKELKLPSVIKDKLAKDYTADKRLKMGVTTVSDYVATSLTDILVRAVAIIIIYIIVHVAITVVMVALGIITRLPIIKGVNKWLGGVAGLAEAVVILWILCFVLTACGGTAAGGKILEAVSSNEILNFIYSNNPIMKFLLK